MIVRAADTDRFELAPQASGLPAISLGLCHKFSNDHDALKQGMVIYDSLYSWCQSLRGERHPWTDPNTRGGKTS
jgi:hypothetical protein